MINFARNFRESNPPTNNSERPHLESIGGGMPSIVERTEFSEGSFIKEFIQLTEQLNQAFENTQDAVAAKKYQEIKDGIKTEMVQLMRDYLKAGFDKNKINAMILTAEAGNPDIVTRGANTEFFLQALKLATEKPNVKLVKPEHEA